MPIQNQLLTTNLNLHFNSLFLEVKLQSNFIVAFGGLNEEVILAGVYSDQFNVRHGAGWPGGSIPITQAWLYVHRLR